MTLLQGRINGLTEEFAATVHKLVSDVKPKTVHHLRTTIRRIESLISYAHPGLGKKLERSLEKLADLRKRAGKVRDVDIQLELLGMLANRSTTRDRDTLAELLNKKRARQAKRLSFAAQKLDDPKFLTRLKRVAEKVGDGPAEEIRPLAPLEEASMQLGHLADDYAPRQEIKPGRLHAARIQLKKIRYLAELAEESPEQKALMQDLKSVQDAVGEWHDWQELAVSAEKYFRDRVNCPLLREIRTLLAARQSTANSAIIRLLAMHALPSQAKKLPVAIQPVRTTVRLAR